MKRYDSGLKDVDQIKYIQSSDPTVKALRSPVQLKEKMYLTSSLAHRNRYLCLDQNSAPGNSRQEFKYSCDEHHLPSLAPGWRVTKEGEPTWTRKITKMANKGRDNWNKAEDSN